MQDAEPGRPPMVVIAAVNDEAVLARDLAASPAIAGGRLPFWTYRGARNMAEAYNAGIRETDAPYMIFAHQDVYLPEGWDGLIAAAIGRLDREDPDWAVLGIIGVTTNGKLAGRVWSSGSAREFSHPVEAPQRVQSLDELVLVLRRSGGLAFDPDLPHFHLYGTDIVQIAAAAGRTTYAVEAPVIHNSDQLTGLNRGYRQAYRHLCAKWHDRLPIRTPICALTADARPLGKARRRIMWRYLKQMLLSRGAANRGVGDPGALAARLGYE